MTIKHYDAQSWLKEKEARRLKLPAFLFALFGIVLTCLLAGCLVGVFFRNIFWFCAIGIAVISLPYVLMDRVHLRFYHGYAEGKKLWALAKYAYTSTDYWPSYPFFWGGWWYRWWYWW
ncbi:MAG: hypothetical protein GJT30_03610 [Geobacter sp.]|nr:hypothetical protein [Geobacter sp.]